MPTWGTTQYFTLSLLILCYHSITYNCTCQKILSLVNSYHQTMFIVHELLQFILIQEKNIDTPSSNSCYSSMTPSYFLNADVFLEACVLRHRSGGVGEWWMPGKWKNWWWPRWILQTREKNCFHENILIEHWL